MMVPFGWWSRYQGMTDDMCMFLSFYHVEPSYVMIAIHLPIGMCRVEIRLIFFELDTGHPTIFLSMRTFTICLATLLHLKLMVQTSPTIYALEQRFLEGIKAR